MMVALGSAKDGGVYIFYTFSPCIDLLVYRALASGSGF